MGKDGLNALKFRALNWANSFDVCCFLDSNQYQDKFGSYNCLIAVGVENELVVRNEGNAFSALTSFANDHKQWMFGCFSFELKNEVEALKSAHQDPLEFPNLYFFIPRYLIAIKDDEYFILKGDRALVKEILDYPINIDFKKSEVSLVPRINKNNYIDKVNELKEHISRGDIYEVNFCQEFYAENANIDPLAVFNELNAVSPTPFAGFFKINDKFILAATPERFICKRGSKLVSQPIKGTAKRSSNPELDEKLRSGLKSDEKEKAENVMIVDLVRNDLTKSAVKGSVKVEELFGVYSFKQVHQMISSISCELSNQVHFIEAIKNAFPMGSMTGAPKIKALELIDQHESSARGMYSGSFGWISPEKDFDFNVVIRSILYNSSKKYLSFHVGSAITYASTAETEYEECLLKASAIMDVLKK